MRVTLILLLVCCIIGSTGLEKNTFAEDYKAIGPAIILGDSTAAAYLGQAAAATLLAAIPDTDLTNITSTALPGHTIAQQKTAYEALSAGIKSSATYVIVMVGLNDLNPAESAATALARYQGLIDSIAASSPAARIYTATMTPCKERLTDVYGETDGLVSYQKWLDMNTAITGSGVNAITGQYGIITDHSDALNDGYGNLVAVYDYGDHVHPLTTGRQVIANAWAARLISDGTWYFDTGTATLNGSGEINIGPGGTIEIQ